MSVEFQDFRIQVKEAIDDKITAVLEECAGELEGQASRNTRVASSKTKTSWEHKVKGDTAYIGSPDENSIWEEFGTGEYALEGNGRSGYWVFVKGKKGTSRSKKTYTLKEAKKIMAILRKKGLEAYYTKGKRPSRAFWKAYVSMKSKIISRIQNAFKGL